MSNVPFKIPAELSAAEARKAAEKGLAHSREMFEKFNAAAKDAFDSIEVSSSIAAKGLSEFNAKAVEAFQANSALAFEFFGALAGTKRFSDAIALAPAHANKQYRALAAQSKDLSSLAQKIAQESVGPLKDSIIKTFQPLA